MAGKKRSSPSKTFDPKRFPNIIPTYTVTLDLGSDKYEATSDDLSAALLALNPRKISTKGIFTLKHRDLQSVMSRTVPQIKRVVGNKNTALYFGRALLTRLR